MTNEEYLEKLNSVAFGRSFEPGFLETWFAESLKILEILAQQSKQIDHPRHRGDSREDSFQKFLRSILSPNHLIIKGFAVDKYASMSKEQDNLRQHRIIKQKEPSCQHIAFGRTVCA